MGSGRVVSAERWRDGGDSVRLLAQLGDCYEQRREVGMAWGKARSSSLGKFEEAHGDELRQEQTY